MRVSRTHIPRDACMFPRTYITNAFSHVLQVTVIAIYVNVLSYKIIDK